MKQKNSFQGEMMLAGWSDSHTGGSKVTFWLPEDKDLDIFRAMTVRKGKTAGQRFMAVLVEIGEGEELQGELPTEEAKPEKRPPNELARRMHVDGYFRNPKLWDAMETFGIYTQEEHKEWIESLPCTIDFTYPPMEKGFPKFWYNHKKGPPPCEGDIVCHHAQSAAIPSAGNGQRKAPYWYGIPLCAIAHHVNWAHASHGATREDKEHVVEHAIALTAFQMKRKLKEHLRIESLAEIDSGMLDSFEVAVELK